MKPVWMPIIPIRWKTNQDGSPPTLQQAWGEWVQGPEKLVQTYEVEWRDVPFDIEDRTYWSREK